MADNHKISALLADDEPYYLEWLEDYLLSKGVEVDYASTVDEAVEALRRKNYRFLVVDLNIPMLRQPTEQGIEMIKTYESYPGLYLANYARNHGYRGRQVMIYSVFTSREIEEAAGRLYCTYLTKGHPIDLKQEVDQVLQYDPSSSQNASQPVSSTTAARA